MSDKPREEKPVREWTILGVHQQYDDGLTTEVYLQGGPPLQVNEQVRVVEREALTALQESCEALKRENEELRARIDESYQAGVIDSCDLRIKEAVYKSSEINELQTKLAAAEKDKEHARGVIGQAHSDIHTLRASMSELVGPLESALHVLNANGNWRTANVIQEALAKFKGQNEQS